MIEKASTRESVSKSKGYWEGVEISEWFILLTNKKMPVMNVIQNYERSKDGFICKRLD